MEINGTLSDEPATVNDDPEGAGWFLKIKVADPKEIEALMDIDAYQAFLQTI